MASISQKNPRCFILQDLVDDSILKEDSFINGDDDLPYPDDLIKNYNKRMSYTIEEKLFFVKLLQEKSQKYIAKTYGIPEKNLRRWRDQESKLLLAKFKKNARRIIEEKKPGNEPATKEIEGKLLLFIKHARDLEICIGTNEIIIRAYELMPSLKELTYKSMHNWCYRFLQRNELTLRAVTHIGQTIKNNSSEAMANFILYCQDAIKKLNIKILEDLNAIGNMDETPVFFEMYQNKTIAKIGAKKVNIKSFGCDKLRISIILTILANGDKLAPLIVFKGKPGKTLETRLSKHIHCINEKIFVKTQENSWVDKDIFKFWLHNIWFKYNKLHSKKITSYIR